MSDQCHLGPEGKLFLAISILLFFIAALIIPLRIYVRLRISRAWGWDDVIIVLAWVISLGGNGLSWHVVYLGLGRPLDCLQPTTAIAFGKYIAIAEIVSLCSMVFSRLSVVVFVLRIFSISKHLSRFLRIWATYMFVQQLICAFLPLAYCDPLDAYWNPVLAETARCWSHNQQAAITVFNGVTSAVSDLILALLPSYFLCMLHLSSRKRVGLVILMALGLIPAGCAIGRTVLSHKLLVTGVSNSWAFTTLFIFGCLEMYTLLICATIPSLVPLYYKLRYTDGSRTYNQQTIAARAMSHGTQTPTRRGDIRLAGSSSFNSSKGILRTDTFSVDTVQ